MRTYIRNKKKEDAVSPVVGIMLMLVITVIIAAIVSAFASGLASDTEKLPVIFIKGAYERYNATAVPPTGGNLTLELVSGDPLHLGDVEIIVSPGPGFKQIGYGNLAWTVVPPDAPVGEAAPILMQGKNSIVNKYKPIQGAGTSNSMNANYGFDNVNATGKYMTLKLAKDGKVIAMTDVLIL